MTNPLVHWRHGPWLALAKPAGVPVFPRHGLPDTACLQSWLEALEPARRDHDWPPGFAAGIAHRLDIPTSGVVLAAATPGDLATLRGWFSERRLTKRYRFITGREVPWQHHTVSHRLAHDRRRKRRMVFERGRATPHRGRWLPAETRFALDEHLEEGLGRWRAEMQTGVMHQIRVHAASVGLALAGDTLYGGGTLGLKRPDGATFLLHHEGLEGPGLRVPPLPVPGWWPKTSRGSSQ